MTANTTELLLPLTWEQVRDIDTALRERVHFNQGDAEFLEHLRQVIAKLEPLYNARKHPGAYCECDMCQSRIP